jgi:opacity protein-like surface antigen
MKKLVLIFFAVFITTSHAIAARHYLSGNIGLASLSNSSLSFGEKNAEVVFYNGYGVFVAIGGPIKGDGRIEVELAYRENPLDKIIFKDKEVKDKEVKINEDYSTFSLMGNLFLETPTYGSDFTPYFAIGLGATQVKLGGVSDTVPAYQFIVGTGYSLNENWILDLQYRFFGTFASPTFGVGRTSHNSNNLVMGLRRNF